MYRKNVVIVVFDQEKNLCLVGNRAGFKDAWQFPQGGVDLGESFLEAAKRELYEEMGISYYSKAQTFDDWVQNKERNLTCSKYANLGEFQEEFDPELYSKKNDKDLFWSSKPNVELIKAAGPYRYDYPSHVKRKEVGQEQIWVLAIKNAAVLAIKLNSEFSAYTWLSPAQIAEKIVDFKQKVYENALSDLGLI